LQSTIVGSHGSGTIFATHCNLGCIFCQNYDISHLGHGKEISIKSLAEMMLELQCFGCHNINFVTPTHIVPFILAALIPAIEGGLKIPIVYNSSGYESISTLKLLEGVVDIFMPDFKFANSEAAQQYAHAHDYFEVTTAALKEMHRQVGDLVLNELGIARRGLLVRHLVMPGALADTKIILKFIAEEISQNTYVNIMAQYRPCGQANRYPEINRSLSYEEYRIALSLADRSGLKRLDKR
jgi:putative pyruvate formate lyase activating enzyme